MLNKSKNQLLIGILSICVLGLVYFNITSKPSLEQSLQVVLNHQTNWRQQAYDTGKMTPPLYIGLFKSRPTGATATIVWHDRQKKEKNHILITRQMRKDTDGILKEFFENPAGFYNGSYDETHIPHTVTETTERKIERLGGDAYKNRRHFYAQALSEHKETAKKTHYTLDSDLLSTALREILEETGVDLLPLLADPNTKVIDLEPFDTQIAYVRNVLIHITSDERPVTKLEGDEVLWAGWASINDFSDDGLRVSIDGKQYHFKPSQWLKDRFMKVIQSLKQEQ